MKIRTAIFLLGALGSTTACLAQNPPNLYAGDVIAKLADHNSQRDSLGGGYSGSRRYVFENQHLNKHAELLVRVKCDSNGTKHFEVVSEEGWSSANKRVLGKMLESEAETSQPQIRPMASISPENYQFQMLGSELVETRPAYVIQVLPKREDKYLFEGRIWVDAQDFALVRVEGKPAKNPSFWTRSIHFAHQYHKSGAFWFPSSTESVTEARLFGKTDVTISYFDYQSNSAAALSVSENEGAGRNGENHAHN